MRAHLIPTKGDEDEEAVMPFLSNVDAVTSHVLFVSLRDFVTDMNTLWHAVCTLLQNEQLYQP